MAAQGTGRRGTARSFSRTASCAARIGCAGNRGSNSYTAGSRCTGRRTDAGGNHATGQ